MTLSHGTRPHRIDAIDWLFSQYSTPLPSVWQPPDIAVGTVAGLPRQEPESPPTIQNAADLRAANEWLRGERQRLQEYTELQLARIQGEHQALVSQQYLNEQKMILGCQELSRKEDLLARQSRTLQQQAVELSQRERTVAGQLEQWSSIQGELTHFCQTRAQTEQETAQQQALVESLRGETLALQKSRTAIQAELEGMARVLEEQREARAKERALTRAHQDQMARRLRDLDQAEQAAQRRRAELDELEVRLRDEFEEQERQLAEQRRSVAALYARLRQQLPQESGVLQDRVALADRHA